jgi:hypothetical protein
MFITNYFNPQIKTKVPRGKRNVTFLDKYVIKNVLL